MMMSYLAGWDRCDATGRPDQAIRNPAITRGTARIRPEYNGARGGSGDARAKAVVGPRHPRPRPRRVRRAQNKVCMCVDIASIDVDDVRPLDEGLAVEQAQLDTVFARFDLERKPAGEACRTMLPLTRVDVHDLDGAAGNRARAFGTSNSAADRSVGLNRFRAEVHDR